MAHILIVDSDEAAAETAASELIDAGHACGWVTSGDKALTLLEWRRPELLLLAGELKGLSGPQLLRELRQSARHHDLPVIFMPPNDPAGLRLLVERALDARQARSA